ncbi:hypothetical protein GUITHDRAFT_141611 [Guillardia theta CCMP2712]|uniref:Uncharacterized protein n=1 Tax=Guillardia theta (strain CCMP2712) TaxID=905079 RepID=L1J151_GUITC|nr:hypothetical protein GUITHDRAFT_141611 [Guillardia theta CCMP2712]EKX41854.1 hypothetical protein GUITHDRAFT_141611 [Guillardia theta CCMP2712]|eukprot:XP_005828834.1 hypothetical protein GUITHDRAFT_141611 [Guillardia theta CCMP2712]
MAGEKRRRPITACHAQFQGAISQFLNREERQWSDVVSYAGEWDQDELESFPMRASCIKPSTKIENLNITLRVRLLRYIFDSLPEFEEAVEAFDRAHLLEPKVCRVKEIIESIEMYKFVRDFLLSLQHRKHIDRVLDVACGHGLVGILLARRFPSLQVTSLDLVARPAFDVFRDGWDASMRERGQRSLGNVEKLEGDFRDHLELVTETTLVLSVHGCNEVNNLVIETARSRSAAWAALPCCIRDSLFLPSSKVHLMDGCAAKASKYFREFQGVRHAFFCGCMMEKYEAERLSMYGGRAHNYLQILRSMDSRITDKGIFLAGGRYISVCGPLSLRRALRGKMKLGTPYTVEWNIKRLAA